MTIYKLTDFNGNQIPISDQNLVINGDFQVWPRGEIFSNIANQYTAAMWKLENANTQISVVEKSSDIPEGVDCKYSIHIKDTGTVANIYFSQYLKNGLKGKYVLSFWYKSTSNMNSYIYDNGSAQLFMSENTNGIWKYKMLKINATNLTRICLIQDGCNGDFYLASVRLYSGEVDFKHIEEDEAIAQMRSEFYLRIIPNIIIPAYEELDGYTYFSGISFGRMAGTPSVSMTPIGSTSIPTLKASDVTPASIGFFSCSGSKVGIQVKIELSCEP